MIPKNNTLNYFLIFFLTLITFHAVYGLNTLNPTNINWLMSAYHDWGAHYLGWANYKNEPWTFPLGDIKSYNYPVGSNVGFTDSIPLFALFFKLFGGILPDDFQYFGLWMFLSHFLIGVYVFRIFELYKVKRIITYLAIGFLICNPVVIFRGIHPALTAQWLFLACFYYYLVPTTKANSARINRNQILVLFISAAANPYLTAMVFLFNIIIPFKHWYFDKSIDIKRLILYPALSVATVLIFWYLLGMIGTNEETNLAAAESFDQYSFNLNSFFNSYGHFSRILPDLGFVDPKQYEGFAYFGVGILCLILIAVALFIVRIKQSSKAKQLNKYLPLAIACLLLFLFSVSNVVTFGTTQICKLPLLDIITKVGNVFRASGRFAWPFYYMIIVFSLLVFAKASIKPIVKYSVLIFLFGLQLYDTQDMILKNNLPSGKYDTALSDEKWIPILKSFDEIITYPPFQPTLSYKLDYQDLCFLTLKAGKPITNGYVARNSVIKTAAFIDSLRIKMDNAVTGNKLFITKAEYLEDFNILLSGNKVTTNVMDGFIFIYPKEKNLDQYFDSDSETAQEIKTQIENLKSHDSYIIDNYKPIETDAIQYNFDGYTFSNGVLRVNGWACIKTAATAEGCSISMVIRNGKSTLKVPATPVKRPDVTAGQGRGNLDDSGFKTIIFTNVLDKGDYDLGILIETPNGVKTYTKTDKKLHLTQDKVTLNIKPKEAANFVSKIDALNLERFFPIKSQDKEGLVFLENTSTKSPKLYLNKGNYKIVFEGISYPDKPLKGVNAHFIVKNKGQKIGEFHLNENTKTPNPSVALSLPSNQEIELEIAFDNDEMVNGVDRNARINKISILPK